MRNPLFYRINQGFTIQVAQAKDKTKSKTLKCRGSGGNGGFFGGGGVVAESAMTLRANENNNSTLEPQKTSAPYAASAFQDFAFAFGFVVCLPVLTRAASRNFVNWSQPSWCN